jgi:hypothetical protein
MAAVASPRYRHEGGKTCIDIQLKNADQLFDGRDPAPFRERDLDEDAVDYIVGAVQELPAKAEIKIVLWISSEPTPGISAETLVQAVRAHFRYEIGRLQRRIREHVRLGQLTLAVGLVVLTVFLTLAELTRFLPASTLRQILREGLVITAWVAMWRPLEVLLYDWWPLARQRRILFRILGAGITVEQGGRGEPPMA